ncbi:bromodomain-containing protein DDB_G0270170-like [Eurosta solidaginis]|uniref:bromodomain-containing protein DDB_G0270170-like n=1 Tax=Eurosta solidaginis TaxID=178769 RepID=UPI0035307E1C
MFLRNQKVVPRISEQDSDSENSDSNSKNSDSNSKNFNSESSDSENFDFKSPVSEGSTTYSPSTIKNLVVRLSLSGEFHGFEELPETNISNPPNSDTNMATPEEKRTFISMCAGIMRENYSGEPLRLESFINKIELIEEFVDENLTGTCISYIKSKLDGKAREAIPTQVLSVNDIKIALRYRIKPDNSKVVAGKIAALQVNNNNYTDFAKRVEELSDALERSLIIEGITQAKAHEMTIEQAVNVCRLNAKTSLVKSILASTNFSDSKDVVAKLIVEQSNEMKERQVLAFRARNNNNFRNFQSNNRGRNFQTQSRIFNNYRQNRPSFSNSNYGNNFNRGNQRQNFRSGGGNRHQSNNNNNSNNSRTSNNNGSNTSNNRGRNASVRALNREAPQERTLREDETNY